MSDKQEKLEYLFQKLQENGAGKIYSPEGNIVFGYGDPDADLFILGEAPGEEEEHVGVPFVGPSGQLLDKILKKLEISRDDIYITNVMKKRPPGNRTPKLKEMEQHAPFLKAQIAVIQPRVILTLGRSASSFLTVTEGQMRVLRKLKRLRYHDDQHDLEVPVIATWHPSYVLRSLQGDDKAPLRELALDVKRAAIKAMRGSEPS